MDSAESLRLQSILTWALARFVTSSLPSVVSCHSVAFDATAAPESKHQPLNSFNQVTRVVKVKVVSTQLNVENGTANTATQL